MHTLIAWFARNSVAANLLMVFIITWGLVSLKGRIPLEVFPSFELDSINIVVPFAGASPEEVESGVNARVEEAIDNIEGIKKVTSFAREGAGSITLQVASGYNTRDVLNEVKQQVDRITSFPSEVDSPSITIPSVSREVISVVVAGALPERELRTIASRVRDELEALPSVSAVSVSGVRDYEMAIEVSPVALERYQLSLQQVIQAIESNSIDLPAGSMTTASGEILLRTRGQAYLSQDFSNLVVASSNRGTRVLLGDVATIYDGFEPTQIAQQFNGQTSIEIDVFRTGMQSAIVVADEVKAYLNDAQARMPYGVTLGYWRDWSRAVKARIDTLTSSALQGGFLIILLLTLFLRFWVAAWVFVGVPVSILGGLALMPLLGVSLNLLSLFAFILVLGIVVDDAIVTGENIYTHMRRSKNRVDAVINGTQEVAVPVTFGVLTTVAAFSPLLMIEGARGQVFAQIPLVVIPVLLFSIVESKFVLPSHMSHLDFYSAKEPNRLARWQLRIADGLEQFIASAYQPFLAVALKNRYLVLAVFISVAWVVLSLVTAGHVKFVFFPRVQSETARVTLEMPAGTPFEITQWQVDDITSAVQRLQKQHIDPITGESVIESILSTAGSQGGNDKSSHLGRVMFEITPPEERTLSISSQQLINQLREDLGPLPGGASVDFRAEIGAGGRPIDVQITGFDFAQMQAAANKVKEKLNTFSGVSDISDTFEGGKEEILLEQKPAAHQSGLQLLDIANQVRTAYLGSEVQSIQRARDEVNVVVRYPESTVASIAQLRQLPISTPSGDWVPLDTVASINLGRGFATIKRIDGRRTLNVQADANKQTADIESIKTELRSLTEALQLEYPDLSLSLEGEAREQRESFASLRLGLIFVLLVIYTLLAIPFKSYIQPLLVMIVIPFGVVGGVLGHMVMGMSLSIMSYMGMLALCGVVVNDSLVLVDWINRQRLKGVDLLDAVRTSGMARFRAVVLTSLTTFFGLLPLIFETSTQAQFLIPMAVSLGFGILFATLVTLVLIPVNYLVLEDIKFGCRRLFQRIR